MAKLPTIALKLVVPVVPKGAKVWAMLEEDLRQMGCHGLMERLWCHKYEKIVVELLTSRDTRWNGTVRQDPETWAVAA